MNAPKGWLVRPVHLLRERCAAFRRPFWNLAYFLYSRTLSSGHPFMNYGYEPPPGEPGPVLLPQDEEERVCIQLYHHLYHLGGSEPGGLDVLEVGCGRGGGASYAARCLGARSVVGLDLSRANLAFCARSHHVPNLRFEHGEAERLPFPDDSFDRVVSVESSHAYLSMASFLAEARRVLRPGGRLLLADVRDRTALPALESALAASGLRLVARESLAAGVVRSLDRDTPRRARMMGKLFRGPLREWFLCFAGVQGSPLYRALSGGSADYPAFVSENPIPDS